MNVMNHTHTTIELNEIETEYLQDLLSLIDKKLSQESGIVEPVREQFLIDLRFYLLQRKR